MVIVMCRSMVISGTIERDEDPRVGQGVGAPSSLVHFIRCTTGFDGGLMGEVQKPRSVMTGGIWQPASASTWVEGHGRHSHIIHRITIASGVRRARQAPDFAAKLTRFRTRS